MAEKRKKSGATYRREKKQRMEEDKRLGSFLDGFLQRQSCEELCNDAHGSGRGSNLTFLSNDTQNKIVLIISQLITEKIVKALQEC